MFRLISEAYTASDFLISIQFVNRYDIVTENFFTVFGRQFHPGIEILRYDQIITAAL